jgi:methylenetetrahydrofolate reductase (NADPH)
LWETVKRLEPLQPHFVSVTYGAGGSTRERTAARCGASWRDDAAPAAHLTCVDASRDEVDR